MDINGARIHFSDIMDAVRFAGRHGGRIAKCNNTHEVYWYGCSVTPTEILAEANILGISEFGTVGSIAASIKQRN